MGAQDDTGPIVHGRGVDPVDCLFVEGTGSDVTVYDAGFEIVQSGVSCRGFINRPMVGIFHLTF